MIFFFVAASGIVAVFLLTALIGAPYVPSKRRTVEHAFDELCSLTDNDTIIDLGSGDGLVLRMASERGARAIGYEVNPVLVLISRILSRNDPKVEIRLASYWIATFPDDVTVVYTFGETRDIGRMYAKVQREANRLGRTIRFVSHAFEVPGRQCQARSRSHYLYSAEPLQDREA